MNTQSKALMLADWIERGNYNHQDVTKAAAELRRLSAIEDEWARLSQDEGKAEREIERLRTANQEQRAALRWIAVVNAMDYEYQRKARAALVKAEKQS
jgi:hypothetical protein